MEDTQPNPQDPVSLPEDIFFHSLSFLSPFSLATSSSISKLWRRSILSNPTLHTEVDLSRMGKSSTMRLVVATLTRLCRLSNNQVRTLRLNLTCFPVHVDGVKDRKLRDSCLNLLVQIIQDSKDSLEEMTVIIDQDDESRSVRALDEKVDETVIFLLRLLHKLKAKGVVNLQTIAISAAGWFTLKVQKQDSISSPSTDSSDADPIEEQILLESLEVTGDITELDERGRKAAFSILLKKMKIMSGGNGLFTEFDENEAPEWDAKRTFQELVSSSSTLQSLRLGFIGPQMPRASWDFSMRCPRLPCLEVSVFEDEDSQEQDDEFHNEDEIQSLNFPERVDGMKHLKHLKVQEGEFSINWVQASKWMGNQIEHLDLSGKIHFNDQFRIVKNSSSTLRVIKFYGGHQLDFSNFKSTLSFPNLQGLGLNSVNPSILSLFSEISSPKLTSVEFSCIFNDKTSVQPHFDCLRKLVERHCSKLIAISFAWWNEKFKSPMIPFFTESMTFPRLQRLIIRETNKDSVRWFSKFRYPVLSMLRVKEGHKSALKGDLRKFMWKEKLLEEGET